ncbi:MAG: CBS domain-containing protein [Candidatus Helarchaeota archaeon]
MDFNKIKAKDIMVKKLITVTPAEKIGSSDILMVRKGIGCLLIKEGEKLVGIITNRDIIKLRTSADVIHKTVGQIMTKNPMVVSADTDLKSIIRIMVTHSIEHLPVIEDGKPIGLIGHNQVFRAVFAELKKSSN